MMEGFLNKVLRAVLSITLALFMCPVIAFAAEGDSVDSGDAVIAAQHENTLVAVDPQYETLPTTDELTRGGNTTSGLEPGDDDDEEIDWGDLFPTFINAVNLSYTLPDAGVTVAEATASIQATLTPSLAFNDQVNLVVQWMIVDQGGDLPDGYVFEAGKEYTLHIGLSIMNDDYAYVPNTTSVTVNGSIAPDGTVSFSDSQFGANTIFSYTMAFDIPSGVTDLAATASTQPVSIGDTASFVCTVEGADGAALSYQWYYSNDEIGRAHV